MGTTAWSAAANSANSPIEDDANPTARADHLVTACADGNVAAVAAAIAAGAVVNDEGYARGWSVVLPLAAAASKAQLPVAVALLAAGADPNGRDVLHYSICSPSAAVTQLLIDAGSSVNGWHGEYPPLYTAVTAAAACGSGAGHVHALLCQPDLDLRQLGGLAREVGSDGVEADLVQVVLREVRNRVLGAAAAYP